MCRNVVNAINTINVGLNLNGLDFWFFVFLFRSSGLRFLWLLLGLFLLAQPFFGQQIILRSVQVAVVFGHLIIAHVHVAGCAEVEKIFKHLVEAPEIAQATGVGPGTVVAERRRAEKVHPPTTTHIAAERGVELEEKRSVLPERTIPPRAAILKLLHHALLHFHHAALHFCETGHPVLLCQHRAEREGCEKNEDQTCHGFEKKWC